MYLQRYSETKYLNEVFSQLDSSLSSIGALLANEYPDSKFNKNFYYTNIKSIQKTLPEFIESNVKYELQTHGFEDFTNTQKYYYHTGLKAYSSPYQDSTMNLVQLENFHSTPLMVIGYGLKQNKDSIITMNSPLKIEALGKNKTLHTLKLPKSAKTLFFVAENMPDTLRLSISKWAVDKKLIDPIKNINTKSLFEQAFLEINTAAKEVVIKKGKHVISSDLIVPRGWVLILEPGSELDIINNAAIVSYSPVLAEGTPSNKVFIHSSDGTGQGFTVIGGYDNSLLKYVTFKNLNTLQKCGWYLTGAVTFYQSNVIIENCIFEQSLCEDALNLVQSNFTFSNSSVQNTYADGLDSDFSSGQILNSSFINNGNDCIDLSGSTIKIKACTINNSGDKGVSGGENSLVEVDNSRISNAKIAVASKDLSSVFINDVEITNVDYEYVAFQKKPEYGPAKIIVTNTTEDFISHKNIIDSGSMLIKKQKERTDTILGESKINTDLLYNEFK